jgi:hypothetical protein
MTNKGQATARTGNSKGKNNRRSFDCVIRKCANDFAQDDTFLLVLIYWCSR